MVAASINPSDVGMILGNYGKLPVLPAVAGREGVGEIVSVGTDVSRLKPGMKVRIPEEAGAWQTHCVAPASALSILPEGIPDEMAAMAWINPPTAWRLLRDNQLSVGDWIVQNAANSAVGIFVIQMARHLGIHTVNVVRRPELIEPLLKLGADAVVLDNDEYPKNIRTLTRGSTVMLGLNSVGGESAMRVLRSLSDGGRLVTFGAITFESVRFPTRQLIFNNISLSGFWMDHWFRHQNHGRVQIMLDKIFSLMRAGILRAPVAASYPITQVKEALSAQSQPRLGKILLRPPA